MPFCLGKYKMTTTTFYDPTQLTNVTIHNNVTGHDSIDWVTKNNTILENNYAYSKKPLYTVSGLWMEKFLSNTSQLWCTGYKIPNAGNTVAGIEFLLNIKRAARIEDLVIQLTLNGVIIGDNYASTINPVQSSMYTGGGPNDVPLVPVGDIYTYGGTADLWGTTGLTSANIADSSFGVVVSFKSNIIYPHNDTAYLNQASIRVTYA
jgi:hypothetical protein